MSDDAQAELWSDPPLILIVDDNPRNLQVAGNLLQDVGYELIFATDGEEALDCAREEGPELILLDVMMPRMDGYEVCRRLKDSPVTRSIPVLFLTAKTDSEDIIQGFDAGGVDYIAKPFQSGELLARVQTHAQLTRARTDLVQANRNLQKQKELVEKQAARISASNTALRESNAEMKHLNEQKSEFLGIAAHDLKNPLAAISGLFSILNDVVEESDDENNRLDKESREMLEAIETSSTHMFSVIDDLLKNLSLESGEISLNRTEIDLSEIAREVTAMNESQASAKNIELVFESAGNSVAYADRNRMREIVDNLVSNAVKYSPFEKRVWIMVYQKEESPGLVYCSVEDEGPGFKPGDMERLFGRFQKLSARPTGGESSTGLGLSIVKRLVDLHEGKIWVESEPGNGATFFMEIPATHCRRDEGDLKD